MEKKAAGGRISLWRLAALGALLLALFATTASAMRYLATRAPVYSLAPPLLPIADTTPPRYEFSIYGLSSPLGVAASPDGARIYVTEGAGERQIVEFDRSGHEQRRLSPPRTTPAGRSPIYLAATADNLFVVDRLRQTIDRYDRNGSYLGTVKRPADDADWAPLGIAIDPEGNFVLSEASRSAHRLVVTDGSGAVLRSIGTQGSGAGQLYFPNGVATDAQGRIYVADGNNGRAQAFDADGSLIAMFGPGRSEGQLSLPRGVAVDTAQHLYVVDAIQHSVIAFNIRERPKYLFSFGSHGVGDGQFNYPNGIACDPTGRIYVTDRENGRVQVWLK